MMTAEQLQGSILQLAIQGKLVPQNPDDSSVNLLLKSCQDDKLKAIKEGKYKKEKFKGALSAEEYPFDIPENWCFVHISDMALFQEGPGILAKDFRDTGIPLIRIAGMQTDVVSKEGCNYLDPQMVTAKWDHFRLDIGDVVISTSASMDKIAEVHEDTVGCIVYTGLIRFKMYGGIQKEYFKYFIKSPFYQKQIQEQQAGAAIKHYGPSHLRKMIIPLPPLEEQKRIVAKIEELMPFVERYAATSTKLNTLNTSFPDMMKKSILQEAVQGKLVPQDPNDEPASELLKRIAEEKKRLIKEGKIKKDKNISRIVCDGRSWFEFLDGKKVCIDSEIPFEVPNNWSWVRLNELGDYKKGPFGSALTKSMFVPAGDDSVKVYEQKNAIQKDWTLGEYYIHKSYYEDKMTGFTVEPGDVIVSCAGTIGETYIMPENIEIGIINQALMRMKIYEPMNVSYFLMYFDYVVKASAREQSKGSAIKNIPPFSIFKRILFPVPPLAEQKRILDRLSIVMNEIDNLII